MASKLIDSDVKDIICKLVRKESGEEVNEKLAVYSTCAVNWMFKMNDQMRTKLYEKHILDCFDSLRGTKNEDVIEVLSELLSEYVKNDNAKFEIVHSDWLGCLQTWGSSSKSPKIRLNTANTIANLLQNGLKKAGGGRKYLR